VVSGNTDPQRLQNRPGGDNYCSNVEGDVLRRPNPVNIDATVNGDVICADQTR